MDKKNPEKIYAGAGRIIKNLNLSLHPEGGYFRETYRSRDVLGEDALPPGYKSCRNVSTAIYYLITSDSFSALHRLAADEIIHYYSGDCSTVFMIDCSGEGRELILGCDFSRGAAPQVIVPRGCWFGIRVAEGGDYTLMGSTVAPGFDFNDFEIADREKLIRQYPEHSRSIRLFTRG